MIRSGKVYLVGAGPGDPSLITMKGMDCLSQADVVLYDYLAHPTLLAYCKKDCHLINVGKQKGAHSQTQDQINQLLIGYAQKGFVVVRLKGGDPLIFGRGGEELSVLVEHAIPFEVVPGVTSAIAAPAYAGIPLTHRTLSRSVAFVTGSLEKGAPGSIHIPNADTLVFLMAITRLPVICDAILATDRFEKHTPCALIQHASTAKQKVVIGTVSTICDQLSSISTPALFVVGDVVSFSNQFQWVRHQPLHGKRVVLFRAVDQSKDIISSLTHLGADVIHFPLLQFSKCEQGVKDLTRETLSHVDTLVFTSQNGVTYFFEVLKEKGIDVRGLAHHYICSIGSKTSETLIEKGIFPNEEAVMSTSEGMVQTIHDNDFITSVGVVTSTIGGFEIQKLCKKKVTRLPLYKTEKPDHVLLSIEQDDWIVFTSPSSVKHFFEIYKGSTTSLTAFCIGPTTEKELSGVFSGTIIVAKQASVEGIVEAIVGVATHDI